jgi:hypothetical protein
MMVEKFRRKKNFVFLLPIQNNNKTKPQKFLSTLYYNIFSSNQKKNMYLEEKMKMKIVKII